MGLKILSIDIYKKVIDVIEEEFDFDKFIENLATVDHKINTIVENYESKTKVGNEHKKRIVSILN